MDFSRILKTILPAVVVLVAGLFGINFVYNNYVRDDASTVISLEPAAGDETPKTVEDTAAPADAMQAQTPAAAPATDAAPAMAPEATPAAAPAAAADASSDAMKQPDEATPAPEAAPEAAPAPTATPDAAPAPAAPEAK